MRGKLIVLAIPLVLAVGCGSGSHASSVAPAHPAATVPTIDGVMTLNSSDVMLLPDATSCNGGSGGYSDMAPGAQVTLTSETGTILGSTQLETGTFKPASKCAFSFSFGPVKPTAKFYSVEVSHRGKITESAAELRAAGWHFALTLGDGS